MRSFVGITASWTDLQCRRGPQAKHARLVAEHYGRDPRRAQAHADPSRCRWRRRADRDDQAARLRAPPDRRDFIASVVQPMIDAPRQLQAEAAVLGECHVSAPKRAAPISRA